MTVNYNHLWCTTIETFEIYHYFKEISLVFRSFILKSWLFRVQRGDGMGMPSLRYQIRISGIPMPEFPAKAGRAEILQGLNCEQTEQDF
jgi:hypothetical protein